ncbi:nitroreductase/quinone reductase family protein [Micromonospora radicis]|uniref:nitroreductase/quinone reductase family protein n=1 Tax=Micromonospora radicis TaxID=1894971 RepID=UPI0018F6756C|nr:nitroreductase/quinone reductase family protein [Micromonospora radicis]
MPNDFNQQIIDEFRANAGRVGGPFEGARLVLLTTTGARTGARHTTPVAYLPDGAERILVIASAAGAANHPQWYRNLVADPQVTVEDGTFTYPARAQVLTGAERDRLFARAVEADPGWAHYQAKTSRTIPGGGALPAARRAAPGVVVGCGAEDGPRCVPARVGADPRRGRPVRAGSGRPAGPVRSFQRKTNAKVH